MPGAPVLSACIIARDEEANLPACLASVAFCDEIVVVDSGSRDATVAIARAAGAVVVEQPWLGYGAQRNVAIDHARGTWLLEVDADERISPELRAEIEAFTAAPPAGVDLGGLPLRDVFLGRPLGPSAKYPKYRHRLFRRGAYRHDEGRTVHEGLVPEGPVHAFTGDLVHLYVTSPREAVADAWRYAKLEADQLDAPRSVKAIALGAVARPTVKLCFRLTVDGGWRDGWAGAAKIGLDCWGDALVWLRHAAGRSGAARGRSGVAMGLHFGAWRARLGSARIAVVGAGTGAAAWAAAARASGADVAHVALAPTAPLRTLRALDAAEQLRPLDAIVTVGRGPHPLLRLAAGDALRLDGDAVDAAAACAQALEARAA